MTHPTGSKSPEKIKRLVKIEYLDDEQQNWLSTYLPAWSQLHNACTRRNNQKMRNNYQIHNDGCLLSLWGRLHPLAPVFDASSRGKQYLACNVLACCAADVYELMYWSSQLLDNIVISGDKYHRESLGTIKRSNFEFSLEHLNTTCSLGHIKFTVHLEHIIYGKLYCTPTRTQCNLAQALVYFFRTAQFGILQCLSRSLAFGYAPGCNGGYFMFDCQSKDEPLFPKDQGAAYVLSTQDVGVLLQCIAVTLNMTGSIVEKEFSIHKVDVLLEGNAAAAQGKV